MFLQILGKSLQSDSLQSPVENGNQEGDTTTSDTEVSAQDLQNHESSLGTLNGTEKSTIDHSIVNSEESEMRDTNQDTGQVSDTATISAIPIPTVTTESSGADTDGHDPQTTVIEDNSTAALLHKNVDKPTSVNISNSEQSLNNSDTVEPNVGAPEHGMSSATATAMAESTIVSPDENRNQDKTATSLPSSQSTQNTDDSKPAPIPDTPASPTKKKSFWARLAIIFKPWKWRRKKKSKKMQEKVDGKYW